MAIKLKKQRNKRFFPAFTLIELIIVVVVIALLAGLVSFAAISVQRSSRDSARDAKVKVITAALEKYYRKNGEYPSVALMTSSDVNTIKQKLGLVSTDVLKFPMASSSTSNSIASSAPSTTQLVYAASTTDSTKNTQCQTDVNGYCDAFQLQYKKESNGSIVTLKSLHDTFVPIAAPGTPSPSATATSSSSIDVTWSSVSGASSYSVKYGTASPPTNTASCTSSPCTLSSLSASTTYYATVTATNAYGSTTSAVISAATPSGPIVLSGYYSGSAVCKTDGTNKWTQPTSIGVTGAPAGSTYYFWETDSVDGRRQYAYGIANNYVDNPHSLSTWPASQTRTITYDVSVVWSGGSGSATIPSISC